MGLIVVSRADWGAVPPRNRTTVGWGTRTHFAVHYSAGSPKDTPRSIQAFHMRPVANGGRGWADIGYNFLVDVHGTIYEGRGWETVGAHAAGWNRVAVGVCFIGRDGDATIAAKRSIRALYNEACRRKGGQLRLIGHRDVNPTDCPGDSLYQWVRAGLPVNGTPAGPGEDEDMRGQLGQIKGHSTVWFGTGDDGSSRPLSTTQSMDALIAAGSTPPRTFDSAQAMFEALGAPAEWWSSDKRSQLLAHLQDVGAAFG